MAGALGQAGVHAHEVKAALIGVAGIARSGPPVEWSGWFADWGLGSLRLVPDLEIAHYGAFRGEAGVHVIVGTGSSVVVRDESGGFHYLGGWGWLIDDAGGAVDLGRRFLRSVGDALDRGEEHSLFVRRLLEHWNLSEAREIISRLYGSRNPRAELAQLAPLVTAMAAVGDEGARGILSAAAEDLSRTIRAGRSRLSRRDWCEIAGSGGVLGDVSFRISLRSVLGPEFRWREEACSPLVGALLWCADEAGELISETMRLSLRSL